AGFHEGPRDLDVPRLWMSSRMALRIPSVSCQLARCQMTSRKGMQMSPSAAASSAGYDRRGTPAEPFTGIVGGVHDVQDPASGGCLGGRGAMDEKWFHEEHVAGGCRASDEGLRRHRRQICVAQLS